MTARVAARLEVCGKSLPALPHQERFWNLDCRYPALIGGYACGKSHALLRKSLEATFLYPGVTGIYACLTYPLLRDAIIPEFLRILAEYGLEENTHWRMHWSSMTWENLVASDVNGMPAKILFRPVDGPKNLGRLVSINAGWACLDEAGLMVEEAHRKVSERVRDKRVDKPFVASATTPEGLNWLYEAYEQAPMERAASAASVGGDWDDEEWRYVRGRTEDNPHLDSGYIDTLMARYPEHLVKAYLEGLFVPLFEGLCFRFDRDEHVSAEAEYDPMLPIRMAWDFNVNPMSVSLNHFKGGALWTFDEIVLTSSHTEDVCEEFLGKYGGHANGVMVYGDAGGHGRSTKARWTDYAIIRQHLGQMSGFTEHAPRSNPSQRDSINAMNGLLRNGYGEVSYAVNPGCKHTIKSLQTTRYDDGGGIYKKHEVSYEHLTDGLRYIAWEVAPVERTAGYGDPRKNKRRLAVV